jgi:hypothetical protein
MLVYAYRDARGLHEVTVPCKTCGPAAHPRPGCPECEGAGQTTVYQELTEDEIRLAQTEVEQAVQEPAKQPVSEPIQKPAHEPRGTTKYFESIILEGALLFEDNHNGHIDLDGVDYTEFLKHGWVTDYYSSRRPIGFPLSIERRGDHLHFECKVVDAATAVLADLDPGLGFAMAGRVLERAADDRTTRLVCDSVVIISEKDLVDPRCVAKVKAAVPKREPAE